MYFLFIQVLYALPLLFFAYKEYSSDLLASKNILCSADYITSPQSLWIFVKKPARYRPAVLVWVQNHGDLNKGNLSMRRLCRIRKTAVVGVGFWLSWDHLPDWLISVTSTDEQCFCCYTFNVTGLASFPCEFWRHEIYQNHSS